MDKPYSLAVSMGMLGIFLTLWLASKYFESEHDPREPPLVEPTLPLLGHVVGMARHGPKYFQNTNRKAASPIHALQLFSTKIYVATSPLMVNLVSKNTKSLSFNPFIAEVAIRLTHCSMQAREIIERNIDGKEGKESYVLEIHDHQIKALAPGPEIERLNLMIIRGAWAIIFQYFRGGDSAPGINLFTMLRHVLTISSTDALYGCHNPVSKDPGLEQAFWDFDANLNGLLVNVYPSLTARKGHKARSRLVAAFLDFFKTDFIGHSSYLTEGRYKIATKHGLCDQDAARTEVGNLVGILVNTVPTLFYLLLHIFCDENLLIMLRREILENAVRTENLETGKTFLVVSALLDRCNLLNSVLQETLRTYSEGATVRLVCEDTFLNDQFLLKKGSILQMPNSVIHRSQSVWGNTSFQPDRFLKHDDERGKDLRPSGSTLSGAYRPFGGGSTLCPGRHLATNTLLGLTALLIWRLSIEPMNEKGWVIPEPKQASAVEAVFPPSQDIDVRLNKRDGIADDWDVIFD